MLLLPVSNLVPFLIGKRIIRRYWVQRCTCPVGVCTRPNQVSHQADESEKKKKDGNVLFVKTLLPHQSTIIVPFLGSWSVKKMNNSDSIVPVHNRAVSNQASPH